MPQPELSLYTIKAFFSSVHMKGESNIIGNVLGRNPVEDAPEGELEQVYRVSLEHIDHK